MSDGVRAAVLGATVLLLLAVGGVLLLRSDDGAYDRAGAPDGALPVADALQQAPGGEVAVSGFYFTEEAWPEPRLCSARERGDAPTCVGPYLRLSGLALDRVPLDDGLTRSPGEVTLVGVLTGDALAVSDVVSR